MQPWSVTRVSHRGSDHRDEPPLFLDKPFVPVVGGIQSDLLPELVDDRGREDGFLARLLPVFPPSLPVPGATDAIVSVEAGKAWRVCAERLRNLRFEYKAESLPLTDAAQREFNTFLGAIAAEVNADDFPINLRAPWMKLRSYCARLALILQGMRWAADEEESFEAVDEISVQGAIALVDAFKTHIRRVYRQLPATPGDKKSDGIFAWVRKQGTWVSAGLAAKNGAAGFKQTDADEIQAVLEGLAKRGLLDRRERKKGRPLFRCPRPGALHK